MKDQSRVVCRDIQHKFSLIEMAPKNNCTNLSVFEIIFSYIPDSMCVGPQGIHRHNKYCKNRNIDEIRHSKVRFSSDAEVMPSIRHTLTPPPHHELWYTDEEYKKFEKLYRFHLMEKRSRSLFSPALDASSVSSSCSDDSSERTPDKSVSCSQEPQKNDRKIIKRKN